MKTLNGVTFNKDFDLTELEPEKIISEISATARQQIKDRVMAAVVSHLAMKVVAELKSWAQELAGDITRDREFINSVRDKSKEWLTGEFLRFIEERLREE